MVWRQPMLYLVEQIQPLLPTSLSCRLNIHTFSCRLYELMLKQEISEVGQAKHDLKPGVFLFKIRTLRAPLRSVGRNRWRNMEVGPARFHALLW
ncbi:TPA: hypothetical protein ACTYTR_004312 [Klebsiella michiganensis]|uniref:hypothetical protein n=1 Tax=Klebsiella TaxID=570 RepID=UPI0006675786|nr:hypothetical protein [Klebsiella michiganensis]QLX88279.1 hypothetical protein HV219_13615 [Klebsiella oxytoca]ELO7622346.1 hypothetical protein [Klebsiella michiganensis]ELT9724993.1 hypothetical protein [Klebsiella michiganensis]MBZ7453999.1 hypothetical protein [Klebsiella michiganensis]MCW9639353.1 hypothetical protein [Klebsiella michiganensis]